MHTRTLRGLDGESNQSLPVTTTAHHAFDRSTASNRRLICILSKSSLHLLSLPSPV